MKRVRLPMILPAVLLSAALLLPAPAGASTPDSKAEMMAAEWRYDDIVDVDFVEKYVAVPPREDVMIIDARPYKPKYVKGHIPGAVSLPFSAFDEKKKLLPEDKDTLVIFYCGGFHCKLSHKSAKKAEALGYTNIKVFAAGYPGWLKVSEHYATVSAEYVRDQIAENQMLLVDARPKRPKYDKGHIPSAISLPFSQFDKLKGKLPRDPETPLVFYCGGFHCKLSHKSAKKAMAMGYTDVKVFAAGYPAWKKEYGAGAAALADIGAGTMEGSIDHEDFKKIVTEKPESILLVDVRDKDEFSKAHIPSSVNIPSEKLEKKMKSFTGEKPIVFVCSTGSRSGEAYFMMQDKRPDLKKVYYLEGQVTFKPDGSFTIKKSE
jgi:rhodanese-related sulfurtransferase